MSIYVYADASTKQIVSITRHYLEDTSFLEIVLDDEHPIASDKDPYGYWTVNATNDGVQKLPISFNDAKIQVEDRKDRIFRNATSVIPKLTVTLSGTHTPAQVMGLVQLFALKHAVARFEYIFSGNLKILADIAAPDQDHDFWLDLEISSGVTYKQFLIAGLTPSA